MTSLCLHIVLVALWAAVAHAQYDPTGFTTKPTTQLPTPKPPTTVFTTKPSTTMVTTKAAAVDPATLECSTYFISIKLEKAPPLPSTEPYDEMKCHICDNLRMIYRCYPCFSVLEFQNVTSGEGNQSFANVIMKFGCEGKHLRVLDAILKPNSITNAECRDAAHHPAPTEPQHKICTPEQPCPCSAPVCMGITPYEVTPYPAPCPAQYPIQAINPEYPALHAPAPAPTHEEPAPTHEEEHHQAQTPFHHYPEPAYPPVIYHNYPAPVPAPVAQPISHQNHGYYPHWPYHIPYPVVPPAEAPARGSIHRKQNDMNPTNMQYSDVLTQQEHQQEQEKQEIEEQKEEHHEEPVPQTVQASVPTAPAEPPAQVVIGQTWVWPAPKAPQESGKDEKDKDKKPEQPKPVLQPYFPSSNDAYHLHHGFYPPLGYPYMGYHHPWVPGLPHPGYEPPKHPPPTLPPGVYPVAHCPYGCDTTCAPACNPACCRSRFFRNRFIKNLRRGDYRGHQQRYNRPVYG